MATVEGLAENSKLGACVRSESQAVWIDALEEWPAEVVGKSVRAAGKVAERHDLPVFIRHENEPVRAGIPVPEGTDLEKASLRYVLIGATWKVREEK